MYKVIANNGGGAYNVRILAGQFYPFEKILYMRNGMQNRTFQDFPEDPFLEIASYLDCNDMAALHQTASRMRKIVNETPASHVRFFDKITSTSKVHVAQGSYENVSSRLNERYRIMQEDLEMERRGVTTEPGCSFNMGGEPNYFLGPEERDYVVYNIMLTLLIGFIFNFVVNNKTSTESSYAGLFILLELALLLFNLKDNEGRYSKIWMEKQQLNKKLEEMNKEFPPKIRPL